MKTVTRSNKKNSEHSYNCLRYLHLWKYLNFPTKIPQNLSSFISQLLSNIKGRTNTNLKEIKGGNFPMCFMGPG